MKNIDIIADTLKKAKENHWPYPKTFQSLKEAGVLSYKVAWGEKYEGVYKGTFGEWREAFPHGFKPIKRRNEIFNEEQVKKAIERHQKGLTDFITLLLELAEAGVSHYTVDMDEQSVTYYDSTEKCAYRENIPQASDI